MVARKMHGSLRNAPCTISGRPGAAAPYTTTSCRRLVPRPSRPTARAPTASWKFELGLRVGEEPSDGRAGWQAPQRGLATCGRSSFQIPSSHDSPFPRAELSSCLDSGRETNLTQPGFLRASTDVTPWDGPRPSGNATAARKKTAVRESEGSNLANRSRVVRPCRRSRPVPSVRASVCTRPQRSSFRSRGRLKR